MLPAWRDPNPHLLLKQIDYPRSLQPIAMKKTSQGRTSALQALQARSSAFLSVLRLRSIITTDRIVRSVATSRLFLAVMAMGRMRSCFVLLLLLHIYLGYCSSATASTAVAKLSSDHPVSDIDVDSGTGKPVLVVLPIKVIYEGVCRTIS